MKRVKASMEPASRPTAVSIPYALTKLSPQTIDAMSECELRHALPLLVAILQQGLLPKRPEWWPHSALPWTLELLTSAVKTASPASIRNLMKKCHKFLAEHSLRPSHNQPPLTAQPRVLDWLNTVNSHPPSRSCARPAKVVMVTSPQKHMGGMPYLDTYLCYQCNAEFSTKDSLQKHQVQCRGGTFELPTPSTPPVSDAPSPNLPTIASDMSSMAGSCGSPHPSLSSAVSYQQFVAVLDLLPLHKARKIRQARRRNTECETIDLDEPSTPLSPSTPRTPKLLISQLSREAGSSGVGSSGGQGDGSRRRLSYLRLSTDKRPDSGDRQDQEEERDTESDEESIESNADGTGEPAVRKKSLFNIDVSSSLGQRVLKHMTAETHLPVISDLEEFCRTPIKDKYQDRLRTRQIQYPVTWRLTRKRQRQQDHCHLYKLTSAHRQEFKMKMLTGLSWNSRSLCQSLKRCSVPLRPLTKRTYYRWRPSATEVAPPLETLTGEDILRWTGPRQVCPQPSVFPKGPTFLLTDVDRVLGLKRKDGSPEMARKLLASHCVSETANAELQLQKLTVYRSLLTDLYTSVSSGGQLSDGVSCTHATEQTAEEKELSYPTLLSFLSGAASDHQFPFPGRDKADLPVDVQRPLKIDIPSPAAEVLQPGPPRSLLEDNISVVTASSEEDRSKISVCCALCTLRNKCYCLPKEAGSGMVHLTTHSSARGGKFSSSQVSPGPPELVLPSPASKLSISSHPTLSPPNLSPISLGTDPYPHSPSLTPRMLTRSNTLTFKVSSAPSGRTTLGQSCAKTVKMLSPGPACTKGNGNCRETDRQSRSNTVSRTMLQSVAGPHRQQSGASLEDADCSGAMLLRVATMTRSRFVSVKPATRQTHPATPHSSLEKVTYSAAAPVTQTAVSSTARAGHVRGEMSSPLSMTGGKRQCVSYSATDCARRTLNRKTTDSCGLGSTHHTNTTDNTDGHAEGGERVSSRMMGNKDKWESQGHCKSGSSGRVGRHCVQSDGAPGTETNAGQAGRATCAGVTTSTSSSTSCCMEGAMPGATEKLYSRAYARDQVVSRRADSLQPRGVKRRATEAACLPAMSQRDSPVHSSDKPRGVNPFLTSQTHTHHYSSGVKEQAGLSWKLSPKSHRHAGGRTRDLRSGNTFRMSHLTLDHPAQGSHAQAVTSGQGTCSSMFSAHHQAFTDLGPSRQSPRSFSPKPLSPREMRSVLESVKVKEPQVECKRKSRITSSAMSAKSKDRPAKSRILISKKATALSAKAKSRILTSKKATAVSAKAKSRILTSKKATAVSAKAKSRILTSKKAAAMSAKAKSRILTSKKAAAMSAKAKSRILTSKKDTAMSAKAKSRILTTKKVAAVSAKAKSRILTSKKATAVSAKAKSGILTSKKDTAMSAKAKSRILTTKKVAAVSAKAKSRILTSKKATAVSAKAKSKILTSKKTTAVSAKAKSRILKSMKATAVSAKAKSRILAAKKVTTTSAKSKSRMMASKTPKANLSKKVQVSSVLAVKTKSKGVSKEVKTALARNKVSNTKGTMSKKVSGKSATAKNNKSKISTSKSSHVTLKTSLKESLAKAKLKRSLKVCQANLTKGNSKKLLKGSYTVSSKGKSKESLKESASKAKLKRTVSKPSSASARCQQKRSGAIVMTAKRQSQKAGGQSLAKSRSSRKLDTGVTKTGKK